MEITNKFYQGVEEYIFHYDHSLNMWLLTATNTLLHEGLLLSDFLILKEIVLPDCTYCYYVSDCAKIKFREHGAYIHIYYEPIKNGQNSKNRN